MHDGGAGLGDPQLITELQEARDRVLVENTAQAVFKHLDRIEDNRPTLGLRWIWELLQNARDSARTTGVHISVRLSKTELRFEHDGKPFAPAEIAHLVYHGSTKIESFENIGQFGSGFLSTHLLSRIVRVAGCLNDSRRFVFPLDRTGDTVEDLRCAMARSWEAFERSLEISSPASASRTSFVYEVAEQSLALAQQGLNALYRCGPLVMAFCPEITNIAVETSDAAWSLKRGDWMEVGEGALLPIQCQHNGQDMSLSVAIAGDRFELCVALQLRPSESGLKMDPEQELAPKLFVLFPLTGSERLGLPATINGKRFKPREDRDGIVLLGDSQGARENRQLLEAAKRHQGHLLEWCAKERWGGTEQLLTFDTTRLPDWVDSEDNWFRTLLTDMVHHARSTPLMPTLGGDWIAPQDAWLPTNDAESYRDRLWVVISSWRGASAKLPRRNDLPSWSRNLSNWADVLDKPPSAMSEAFTIDRLAQCVSDTGSVGELQKRLADVESLPWLVSLLKLGRDAGDSRLLETHCILPTQSGSLRHRSDVRRDDNISENLKDIAEAFDLNVRNELLDARVEVDGITDQLASKSEPQLLAQLLKEVKDRCRDGTIGASLAPWVIKLFWWVATRADYLDDLDGYPVPTTDDGGDEIRVLHLRQGIKPSERPMVPRAAWPEGAKRFASLFPRRRILADAFANCDSGRWQPLAEHGYLNMSPLIERRRTMNVFLPEEPFPDTDNTGSHKSTQEIQVSDVAFLIELIDVARKSKRHATEFIRFLVEFVAATDRRAFEKLSVDCECEQQHQIYRAAWLVPLHSRRWVPLDADGRRAARASAESFARLLSESPDIADRLSGTQGAKLMEALGISRADLALRVVAHDEGTRVKLIHSMQDLTNAAAGDVERVRELVTEIREHPDIIASIEEQKARRERIRRNQEIGGRVEELFRRELEDRGLTVRRTGQGSDFEIEKDEDVWLELGDSRHSTLVEVKSTTVDQVKMTPLQATTACSCDQGFALCVVPLDGDSPTGEMIRKQLRVVFGIGAQLRPALVDYEFLQEAADDARQRRGAIELEVIEGQVRFRIGRRIWGDALTFEQAIVRFAGRG